MDPNVCLWIAALISNIFLLRPLLMIARERTALFLMVGKSCSCLVFIILRTGMYFTDNDLYSSVTMKLGNQLMLINEIHVALLALNRFHAMIWPISYSKHWLKKRTFILIWFVFCPIACAFYFCLIYYLKGPLFGAILSAIPLTIAVIIPSLCYAFLALKILFNRVNLGPNWRQMTAMDKDRLRMFIVFFCSLLPHLVKSLNSAMNYLFPHYITNDILDEIVYVDFILANSCSEEIFLLILCRDFRIAVKQQLIDFYAYWSCQRTVESRVHPFFTTSNHNPIIRSSRS